METLLGLINRGWNVEFYNHPKRMDLGEGRDWHIRFCWKATYNEKNYESEWKGFADAEECIQI